MALYNTSIHLHTLHIYIYIYLYKTVKAIKLHNIKTLNIESIKED